MTTKTNDTIQTFKILIIGDAGVGKTSLMNRFVHGVFTNDYNSTIGVDFKVATVNIGEYKCRLQIWDTAGQERFRSMTNSYYRGADAIVIVYDVTSNESFDSVKSRFSELEFYCDESVPRLLIGNKDDDDNQINKVVLTRYGKTLAEQNNLLFSEISVKDNKNITEAFQKLTKLALQRRLGRKQQMNESIAIDSNHSTDRPGKNRCCFV